MGERGQILIKDKREDEAGIYLYAHWKGYKLKPILQNALAKKWRWDDPEYLARIIFDELIGDEKGTETGFGIGLGIHGDLNYPLLVVNVAEKEVVEIAGKWDDWEGERKWSFQDFIETTFEEE